MSGLFSDEKLQEIRDRLDLVELVSSYVSLKKTGRNHVGLCPFHQEKTPSFNVSPEKQYFKCFGCDAGGDLFEFIMKMEGLSFPEAARRLAERAGVDLEEEIQTPEEQARQRERDHLLRINEVACDYYHQQLLESEQGEAARRYLKKRGYDRTVAQTYRLGFAPEGWENLVRHLTEKGFDTEKVARLGLIREGKEGRGYYDLFRHRLIVPIVGLSGQVLAFGGRVLDDSLPKYINSTESPVYHKGQTLFGLHTGRQAMRVEGEAIVVEGYFDQMALHRAGYPQTVATCGTALTDEHAGLLKRYARRVFLLFDQDKAGQKATFRAMEPLLALGVEARVVALPQGEDPDSYLATAGAEAFRQRLKEAQPVVEAFVDATLAQEDATVEGRVRAAHSVMDRLALLPDAMTQSLYLKMLAQKIDVDEALLKEYRPKVPRRATERSQGGGFNARHPARRGRSDDGSAPPLPEAPPPDEAPMAGSYDDPEVFVPPPRSTGSVAAPPSRIKEPSRAEVQAQRDVLRLMLALASARQQVADSGAETFFVSDDLLAVGRVVLSCDATEDAVDTRLLVSSLDADQAQILRNIEGMDLAPLLEDPAAHLRDCQQTVAATRLKKEMEELRAQITTEQDSEEKTAALLKLIALKKKMKSVKI